MNSPQSSDLQQQFEAAARRVDNLPPEQGAEDLVELYGLYKQATDGDHDTQGDEVDRDDHDNPNGPAGLSQAQWESWSKRKGMPEEEAKRRYVEMVNQLTGSTPTQNQTQDANPGESPNTNQRTSQTPPVPTNEAPAAGVAQVDDPQPGVSPRGGLRGNLDAGTPYGGEDELKLDH